MYLYLITQLQKYTKLELTGLGTEISRIRTILGHFRSSLSPVSITAREIKSTEEEKSSIEEIYVGIYRPFIE